MQNGSILQSSFRAQNVQIRGAQKCRQKTSVRLAGYGSGGNQYQTNEQDRCPERRGFAADMRVRRGGEGRGGEKTETSLKGRGQTLSRGRVIMGYPQGSSHVGFPCGCP
jgi:hypothetical protein